MINYNQGRPRAIMGPHAEINLGALINSILGRDDLYVMMFCYIELRLSTRGRDETETSGRFRLLISSCTPRLGSGRALLSSQFSSRLLNSLPFPPVISACTFELHIYIGTGEAEGGEAPASPASRRSRRSVRGRNHWDRRSAGFYQ